MRIATFLLKYRRLALHTTVFFVAATLLLRPLLPAVWPILPLDSHQLAGLVLAIFGVLVIDFHNVLSLYRPTDVAYIEHGSLDDAISKCIKRLGHIRELRIIASTSRTILPLIRTQNPFVDKCQIFLQRIDVDPTSPNIAKLSKVRSVIDDHATMWRQLQAQGPHREPPRIRSVSVHFLPAVIPTGYELIFDEKLMIVGLFVPSHLASNAVEPLEQPWIVDSSTEAGRLLIDRHRKQFDRLAETYPPG